QQLLYAAGLWVAIILGAGLWAACIASSIGLLWGILFLQFRYPRFLSSVIGTAPARDLAWLRDVWPMQWRIAVCWFGTFYMTQMFTPLLFRTAGPELAGELGTTLTLG